MSGAGNHRVGMPSPLGGDRARLTGLLALVGAGRAACLVAFSVLLHVVTTEGGHIGDGRNRLTGIYRVFEAWPALALYGGLVAVAAGTLALTAETEPLAERLAQSYVHSVRLALFDQVSHSEAWVAQRTVGVTVLRFTGDSNALRGWASKGVATLLVNGVYVFFVMVALVFMAPAAAAAVAGLIVLYGAIAVLLGRALRERVRETRKYNGRLASYVNERVTYAAVMQSLGRVGQERKVLARYSRRFSVAVIAQARLNGALEALGEAAQIGTSVVVFAAALASGARAATLTSLLPIAGFLGSPIADMIGVQQYWQMSRIARRRVTEVLSAPARLRRPATVERLPKGPGRLELVRLAGAVLKEVDVVAEPGSRICLQGEPASGKSLLLLLIARLHVPDGGVIRLDGQDVSRCDPNAVRRAIRLVSLELPLLRGSVESNLRHGEARAARDARGTADKGEGEGERADGLDAWQERALGELLPRGLRTKVGEGGRGLSKAARFQVSLARALRSNPRILLLDEAGPDSALDAEAFDALLASYPGTVIYVSSDPELIGRADTVWSLEAGSLTARRGSADEPAAVQPQRLWVPSPG